MARYDLLDVEAFERVADRAPIDAYLELGFMYSTGRDVPLDFVTAHKWFNIASLRGSTRAKDFRREIALEMDAMEIREAQRLAREWWAVH